MNKKVIKIAIIIAWCLLIACTAFKLFGSEVFNVAVENQRFLEICQWLETDGAWLQYILMYVLSTLVNIFVVLAASLKPKVSWKWLLIIIACSSVAWGVKWASSIAGLILDCLILIVLPALIAKKWYYGFIGLAFEFVFQILSMYIRAGDAYICDDNIILSLVISIDYYIMIALYYMYAILINKHKEEKQNG